MCVKECVGACASMCVYVSVYVRVCVRLRVSVRKTCVCVCVCVCVHMGEWFLRFFVDISDAGEAELPYVIQMKYLLAKSEIKSNRKKS